MAIGKALQSSGMSSPPGASYMRRIVITGDANSYQTGGIPILASDFGYQSTLDFVWPDDRDAIYNCAYNYATAKLQVFTAFGAVEVANGGSTAGLICDLTALGR